MGPISKKVIAELKKVKNKKIIDFKEMKEAKKYAEDLNKTIISEEKLAKYDPLHAAYIYAQNKVSILVEQLSMVPALSKLTNNLIQADDIYLPSSPPQSPLTKSYFQCWGAFDLCAGIKKETFGTIILNLLKNEKADPDLLKTIECMQNSRMGIFVHKGNSEHYTFLEELVTGQEIKAIVPSGYQGYKDQVWFARVMPEPYPELNCDYWVVLTTPYLLTEMKGNGVIPGTSEGWKAFFDRNLETGGKQDTLKKYHSLMKYGKNRHFWNEFIFEGYVNYQQDMIFLAGYPDIPLSMPLSKESQERY